MNVTLILVAIAAYLLVIAQLAIIDWKLTKIISMMEGNKPTLKPMKNNTKIIEFR